MIAEFTALVDAALVDTALVDTALVEETGDTHTPVDGTRLFGKVLAARGLNGAISGMNGWLGKREASMWTRTKCRSCTVFSGA